MNSKEYIRLIEEGNIFSYSLSKGTFILPPNGLILWEQIKSHLDQNFSKLGVQNVSLPTLIPMSLLRKEKNHIDGFAPELFLVSKQSLGMEAITGSSQELALRPTSEVLFYDWFAKSLQTYKQLPFLYNQWCQVFRAEKNTKPFLRNVEFLWQEGHTLHIDKLAARAFTLQILDVYKRYVEEILCLSPIVGLKTSCEKFAGARESYTIECLLPDYQCLQLATSHYFGTKFSDAFNVKFQGSNNLPAVPSSTSWGTSTRAIGAIVLAHSDQFGLVFPFYLAPVQIGFFKHGNGEELDRYQAAIFATLTKKYRCKIYDSSRQNYVNVTQADKEGCAVKVFCGSQELAAATLTVSLRTAPTEKTVIDKAAIESFVENASKQIASQLLAKNAMVRKEHTFEVHSNEQFSEKFATEKGIFLLPFCNTETCEINVKKLFPSFSFRCMVAGEAPAEKCLFCPIQAVAMTYFGRSY